MKKKVPLITGLFALFAAQSLSAQLVNNGAKIFSGQNALIYVNNTVVHKAGELIHNGTLIVAGNWINKTVNSPGFASASSGTVKFTASKAEFSGNGTTVFPKLVFASDGLFTMHTNIGAAISLSLGNAELTTNSNQFTVYNTEPAAVQFDQGFISTGTNGLLVRYLKENLDYIYPLGSKKLGLKRFLVLKPNNATKQIVGAALIANDVNLDGFERSRTADGIGEINKEFYHILKRVEGSANIDATFLTTAAEPFNSLINWTAKDQWEKALPTVLKDNSNVVAGLSKSFFHQAMNLPIGFSIPFAFSQIKTASALVLFNAFSPDGDGKNETWEIKNIDAYPDNELKIFDRSGNLVFRANGYSSTTFWDGATAGSGTYIYVLRVKVDGKDEFFKGTITMVKN